MHTTKLGPITLHMVNGGELKLEDLPPRAVALDGAVQGPAMGDDEDRWSFDHHAGVVRLITHATCEQIRTATHLGFNWSGRDVYVNDLDADTILSLWIIANEEHLAGSYEAQLIRGVNAVDAHGPVGYELLGPEARRLTKIFFAALDDVLPHDIQGAYKSWPQILDRALGIVGLVLDGKVNLVELGDYDMNRLYQHHDGACLIEMAECDGFGGFEELYLEGALVVCLLTDAADGSTRYTIGKKSDLVDYPLGPGDKPGTVLHTLNAMEPGWGGASSIGGSPRLDDGVSSRLSPDQVWKVLCEAARQR